MRVIKDSEILKWDYLTDNFFKKDGSRRYYDLKETVFVNNYDETLHRFWILTRISKTSVRFTYASFLRALERVNRLKDLSSGSCSLNRLELKNYDREEFWKSISNESGSLLCKIIDIPFVFSYSMGIQFALKLEFDQCTLQQTILSVGEVWIYDWYDKNR